MSKLILNKTPNEKLLTGTTKRSRLNSAISEEKWQNIRYGQSIRYEKLGRIEPENQYPLISFCKTGTTDGPGK